MKKYFLEGIKSFGVSNIFMVLNFIGNIFIIRLLDPETFGIFALSIALIGIVEIFTTFSINTIYLQRKHSKLLYNGIVKIILFIIFLKLIAGITVFYFLNNLYLPSIWKIFFIIFLFKLLVPINSILISILEKDLFFYKAALVVNISNLLGIIFSILSILFLEMGIWALVLKEIIPIFFIFIASAILTKKIRYSSKIVPRKYLKILLLKSLEMYWVRGAELAHSRIPVLIIDNFFGPAIVGLYSQSLYLVNILNRITNSLNQQIGIVFFSDYRNNKKLKKQGAQILYSLTLFLGFPVAVILFYFTEIIIMSLFGNKWMEAVPLIKFMSPLVLILPIFTIAKSQLFGEKKNLIIALVYILGTIFFIVGIIFINNSPRLEHIAYIIDASFVLMLLSSLYFLRLYKNDKYKS